MQADYSLFSQFMMNKIKACSTFVLAEYPVSQGNVFHITEVKLIVNTFTLTVMLVVELEKPCVTVANI